MPYPNIARYLSNLPDGRDPSLQRSGAGQEYLAGLRRDLKEGSIEQFDREVLRLADENPRMTIRKCWETVEEWDALKRWESPRPYPFKFDN